MSEEESFWPVDWQAAFVEYERWCQSTEGVEMLPHIENSLQNGDFIMTQTAIQVTSELSIRRVAAYLKQSHKETAIMVQRCEDGSFLISDKFLAVKVTQHPDLFPYTHFDTTWER